jgi:hypothetical protein
MLVCRAAQALFGLLRAPFVALYRVLKILLVAVMCGILPPMKIEDPPPKNPQAEHVKSQR